VYSCGRVGGRGGEENKEKENEDLEPFHSNPTFGYLHAYGRPVLYSAVSCVLNAQIEMSYAY